MILFHNADIIELESILAKGLIPLSKSGNNKWNDGNRSDNSADCVYLFKPLGNENSFVNYGTALIEVDVDDATVSQMAENDAHIKDYIEYTVAEVSVDNIKRIFIPEIFRERLTNGKVIVNEKPKHCAPYRIEASTISDDFVDYLINDEGAVVLPILPEEVLKKITWCQMEADSDDINGSDWFHTVPASKNTLEQFAKTAQIISAEQFNFFRGKVGNKIFDLSNIHYVF